MTKRIEIDGAFFRMRRGKLVQIPGEWVGRMTTPKTIRDRASKQKNKQAREMVRRQRRIGGYEPGVYARLLSEAF